jgi:hypothetical protein
MADNLVRGTVRGSTAEEFLPWVRKDGSGAARRGAARRSGNPRGLRRSRRVAGGGVVLVCTVTQEGNRGLDVRGPGPRCQRSWPIAPRSGVDYFR